jgi:hypothetical protein
MLGGGAAAQLAIFVLTGSIALLADLIHNFGDAATAFRSRSPSPPAPSAPSATPALRRASDLRLGLRRRRRGDLAAAPPRDATHLGALAAAGVIGFAGN